MANLNAPSGLSPVMYRNGNFWNGQVRLYAVAATDTNPYYVGDLVKIDSTNFADANGIPYVTRATAGAGVSLRGVVSAVGLAIPYGYQGGPFVNPNDLTKNFRPTGAQTSVYYLAVVDDPDVVFEIQEDTTSSPGQASAMTKNCTPTIANPATGVFVSGFTLNSNTYATGATLQLKVIQSVQRPDNTPYTAYQKLLVTINQHDFSGGTAGF
jgi:hypothetical protein